MLRSTIETGIKMGVIRPAQLKPATSNLCGEVSCCISTPGCGYRLSSIKSGDVDAWVKTLNLSGVSKGHVMVTFRHRKGGGRNLSLSAPVPKSEGQGAPSVESASP
jgi:hypothetical protein